MPRSEAFLRIKGDVLAIVGDIPAGRVSTYAEIGHHLDVMARHVAYILAMLGDDERAGVPWHRVVADSGQINRTKHGRGREQAQLLESEGVGIDARGRVVDLDGILWRPR